MEPEAALVGSPGFVTAVAEAMGPEAAVAGLPGFLTAGAV